jgi:hypothetical protein
MINDFQGNDCEPYERYPVGFDDYDLRCGISWARELLQEGFTQDTWFNIDLRTFIQWCKYKLKQGYHKK